MSAGQSIPALQSKITAALRQWLWTRTVLLKNGGGTIIPKMHVVLTPGGGGIQTLQDYAGTGLKMLMILSSIVLLIACANIANLLLARATTRRADVAVRMALGAARRHLVRQIVTESVLLSCIGGLAGLAIAYAGCRTILALAFPDARNMPVDASPSLTVLGFAFLVSLITGILFSTGPAWLSTHAQPAEALRGVNRSTRDRSSLPQKALVVLQAALSIVLLCGAVLMTRTLANLEDQNFGIATNNRYVLHFDPVGAGYTVDRLPALYRQIEERFSSLPGVRHVSLAMYSPLEGDNWGECVIQQGHPAPRPGENCGSTWVRVSPQYLESIGVPIRARPRLHRSGHGHFSAGRAGQRNFCQKVLPRQESYWPTLRDRFPGVFRRMANRRRLSRLQDEQPPRSGASGLSAAPFAAVHRLHSNRR